MSKARTAIWCHLHLPKMKAGDPACISITQAGKAVRYTDYVELTDVKFVVQPGGRRRALEEGRKNVHAYVVGQEYPLTEPSVPGVFRYATYNPQKHETFVDFETGEPVLRADHAILHGKTVLYRVNPEA